MDAIVFCAPGGSGDPCEDRMMPEGLIAAASFARAEVDSWIQVLGRLSPARLNVSFSASFTLLLVKLVDRWTYGTRMEPSAHLAGQE